MLYYKQITLKDSRTCILRSADTGDAEEVLRLLRVTHEETDYLATNPGENSPTAEDEQRFLEVTNASSKAVYIVAVLDGRIVGSAGIQQLSRREKLCHRAEFGIAVEKAAWGLGIGRALTRACKDCAARAGYLQLELDVVADNTAAAKLYKSEGFIEYGRNPRGFRTRSGEWQELIMMRLIPEDTEIS
ncbi:MAG: GNAT family N-acetyltransferase [Lachnospiraceae bacterium]|nr:GNAT family N-acetyltransferase [Lachnospiraceae bacterium]